VEAIIILFLNVVQGKWPIFALSSFAYIIERRVHPYKSTVLSVMQILSKDIYCFWQNNLVGQIKLFNLLVSIYLFPPLPLDFLRGNNLL
jgi:hypothetical protein